MGLDIVVLDNFFLNEFFYDYYSDCVDFFFGFGVCGYYLEE